MGKKALIISGVIIAIFLTLFILWKTNNIKNEKQLNKDLAVRFCFGAIAMAWHYRYVFGVKKIRYQAIPCGRSATSSLFRLHSITL